MASTCLNNYECLVCPTPTKCAESRKGRNEEKADMDENWKRRLLDMDAGAERVRYIERQEAKRDCKHPAYSQDTVTGECRCDQCGKLLIDSIGRVLE